jgi:hypothetical protein
LDNGDHDLGKIDNIVVSGTLIPEPSASLQLRIRVGENRRIWEPSGNKEVSHEQEVYCTPHG